MSSESENDEACGLHARLQDGRTVPVEACSCHHCRNEWFMVAYSLEWMPTFCPYCGIKFLGRRLGGDEAEYMPHNKD